MSARCTSTSFHLPHPPNVALNEIQSVKVVHLDMWMHSRILLHLCFLCHSLAEERNMGGPSIADNYYFFSCTDLSMYHCHTDCSLHYIFEWMKLFEVISVFGVWWFGLFSTSNLTCTFSCRAYVSLWMMAFQLYLKTALMCKILLF